MQGTSSVVISVPAASMALMIASITGTARPGIVSAIAPETARLVVQQVIAADCRLIAC